MVLACNSLHGIIGKQDITNQELQTKFFFYKTHKNISKSINFAILLHSLFIFAKINLAEKFG